MKLTKSLFLAFAGLGLFACSNEEVAENNQFPEGNGVVSVKIVTPETLTKAMPGEPSAGTTGPVKVVGDITIALEAGEGGTTHILTKEEIASGATTVKFWNVKNPTKVRVYMNNAPTDGDYSEVSILDLQSAPADIAAYGEVTPTLTSNTESPAADTQTVKNEGNVAEDAGKKYQMYQANVTMEIPVARLEVSGIAHKDHQSPETCEYETLTIDGIYLDNVKATGADDFNDYKFAGDQAGSGSDAILVYPILSTPEGNNNFMDFDKVWPEAGKAYAFNFYPGASAAQNPVLKIYFAQATGVDANHVKSSPRYAMITKYVASGTGADGEALTLQAGKVYRIQNAILDDKNIIGDEGGNTYYGVTVEVTEATWSVETIDGVWVEQ